MEVYFLYTKNQGQHIYQEIELGNIFPDYQLHHLWIAYFCKTKIFCSRICLLFHHFCSKSVQLISRYFVPSPRFFIWKTFFLVRRTFSWTEVHRNLKMSEKPGNKNTCLLFFNIRFSRLETMFWRRCCQVEANSWRQT